MKCVVNSKGISKMVLTGIRSLSPLFLRENPPDLHQQGQAGSSNTEEQVYYTAQKFKSPNLFERSGKFPAFKTQVEQRIETINEFAAKHIKTETERKRIRDNFQTFHNHVFNLKYNFFSDHRMIVYGVGKQSLDTFCAMLKNDQIDLGTRISELMQLAEGVTTCAAGSATHLAIAARELQLKAGGIFGEAWRMKEKVAMAAVDEFIRIEHPSEDGGGDVHLRNIYANYLSGKIGIPKQADPYVSRYSMTKERLEACRDMVESNLMGSRIATTMAEEYIGKVSNHLAAHHDGVIEERDLDKLDPLWTDLRQSYGEVAMASVLQSDEMGMLYQARSNPQLAAIDILTTMRTQGLLAEESKPRSLIAWKENKTDVKLMQWGHDPFVWIERGRERDRVMMKDIEKIKGLPDRETRSAVTQQAIDNTPAQELIDVSPKLLIDLDCIKKFLSRFDSAAGVSGYIEKNKDWIDRLPSGQKSEMEKFILDGSRHLLVPLLARWGLLEKAGENGATPLMNSITGNQVLMAMALVAAGASVNSSQMPLIYAARQEREAIIRILVAAGADLEAVDPLAGMTALMHAANTAQSEAVAALLEVGADPNRSTPEGDTALTLAIAGYCDEALVRLFITKGADPSLGEGEFGNALMTAARTGNVEALGVLVEHMDINAADEDGTTALIAAASLNNGGCVTLLCAQEGINMNARDLEGRTALVWAADEGSVDVVQALLQFMPQEDAEGMKGEALIAAASKGQAAVVKLLIESGADLTVTGARNRTGLTAAVVAGNLDVIKVFIACSADLNQKDGNQTTALIAAAQLGDVQILQALIDANVDLDIQGPSNQTALHCAANRGNVEAVRILVNAGARLDLQDTAGRTPRAAAERPEVIEILDSAQRKHQMQDDEQDGGNPRRKSLRME